MRFDATPKWHCDMVGHCALGWEQKATAHGRRQRQRRLSCPVCYLLFDDHLPKLIEDAPSGRIFATLIYKRALPDFAPMKRIQNKRYTAASDNTEVQRSEDEARGCVCSVLSTDRKPEHAALRSVLRYIESLNTTTDALLIPWHKAVPTEMFCDTPRGQG